jgi:hypothetical protein
MEKQTPFGINYSSNTCTIKLRFHPEKWNKAPIQVGKYRLTKNGYVLFECELNTRTDEYQYVMNQLSKINTSK